MVSRKKNDKTTRVFRLYKTRRLQRRRNKDKINEIQIKTITNISKLQLSQLMHIGHCHQKSYFDENTKATSKKSTKMAMKLIVLLQNSPIISYY